MSTTSSSSRRRTHRPSPFKPASSPATDIVLEEGDGSASGASAAAGSSARPTSLPRGLKDLFVLSTALKVLLFPA